MAQNNRNAVATYTASDVMVPDGFTENVDLILQTYAKDLTPQEFSLFAADAHQRGLSIVKRQIYATKYGGKMTIMVGIDGYRSQAESHPEYAGQDGPYWCGEDGQWRDVWISDSPPMAAKVGIYRKGFAAPVTGIALWSEYNNSSNPSWRKFPTTMLAKCAEAQAIRKAFPSKLGGTYISEEMDQANAMETTGRVVDRSTGEVVDSQAERQRAIAAWHIALQQAGIDEEGKVAWYASKHVESANDVPIRTLDEWSRAFRDRPEQARQAIERIKAAQEAPDATESDETPEQEETPVQGVVIDITTEEEEQYRQQRRVEAAGQ